MAVQHQHDTHHARIRRSVTPHSIAIFMFSMFLLTTTAQSLFTAVDTMVINILDVLLGAIPDMFTIICAVCQEYMAVLRTAIDAMILFYLVFKTVQALGSAATMNPTTTGDTAQLSPMVCDPTSSSEQTSCTQVCTS